MPPVNFHGLYSRYKECNNTLLEQILSYKMPLLLRSHHHYCCIFTRSLHGCHHNNCTSRGDPLLHSASPTSQHALFGLHQHSAAISGCQWVLHGLIQQHTVFLAGAKGHGQELGRKAGGKRNFSYQQSCGCAGLGVNAGILTRDAASVLLPLGVVVGLVPMFPGLGCSCSIVTSLVA